MSSGNCDQWDMVLCSVFLSHMKLTYIYLVPYAIKGRGVNWFKSQGQISDSSC